MFTIPAILIGRAADRLVPVSFEMTAQTLEVGTVPPLVVLSADRMLYRQDSRQKDLVLPSDLQH